ncbi:hypothetical protein DFH06DRAFT_1352163 [Mycena polygramma]|nr:hypothetical protein DFH06DRAFT_1352163 [Mycena polygramma]
MLKLPEHLRLDFVNNIRLQCGLPVWHAKAHEKDCADKFSLGFLHGVGRSDGEGVERLWADLNPSSYNTKDMSVGNRADTVEDKIDSHNYLKNLGCVDILRRKLVIALAERNNQVAAFKEINKTIEPTLREDWQLKIDNWVKRGLGTNPYVLGVKDGPTEAEIRLELRKEEEKEAATGNAPLHGTSATAFLTAGLQLEETQRRIKAELTGAPMTVDRESKVNEQRHMFHSKLRRFRDLQSVYTPGAIRAVLAEEAARDEDRAPPKAEDISLFLPSALSAAERTKGCVGNLPEMEARLREAQCSDALTKLRVLLHSKSHLILFRNDGNVTGQYSSTRSQTLISSVTARIAQHHTKYNQARSALRVLKGDTYAPQFKKLHKTDLTLDGEEKESDTAARTKLAKIGSGKHSHPSRNAPSGNKTLSWIWSAPGVMDKREANVHESIRVEWSKAKARKNRWEEEVALLREEMRRVLRYLEWEIARWGAMADVEVIWDELTAPTEHGKVSYAAKQAAGFRELADFYRVELSMSAGATVVSVLDVDEPDVAEELNDLFALDDSQ